MDKFMWKYNLWTRKFSLEKFILRISLLVSQSQETLLDELPGMFSPVIFVYGNFLSLIISYLAIILPLFLETFFWHSKHFEVCYVFEVGGLC